MKEKFKKRIRKYMSIFVSVLLIPCFICVNTYAYNIGAFNFTPIVREKFYFELNGIDSILTRTTQMSVNANNTYYHNFGTTSVSNYTINSMSFGDAYDVIRYPYDSSLYDYYVCGILSINYARSNNITSNFSGFTDINIYSFDNGVKSVETVTPHIDSISSNYTNSYNFIFPLDDYSNLSVLEFPFDVPLVLGNRKDVIVYFSYGIFSVEKDTSVEQVQSIISAINNQTTNLGSKLEGIDSSVQEGNDLMENGNDATSDAVSDFNEVFEQFNQELDNWEAFDDEILGEFESANEQYLTELQNFELSASLLNAGNWLSTSMQTVYDNSSDFKMLYLVPLLFGLPILLFVIKKQGGDKE